MRMVWIWAALTWSCHQQHKGATVEPEVVDDTDDPSHEGSDGSPDVDSGGTESSDSGAVQASEWIASIRALGPVSPASKTAHSASRGQG
jgi:hypothetical protein